MLEEKRQLLDIAMTTLEALAMLDKRKKVRGPVAEAWSKLKELEDRWDAEEAGD